MNIIQDHIPFSTAHNRRPNIKMVPNSITVHSTGNLRSSAKGERNWLENPSNKRTASWHYVVDQTTIIEAIPPNYVAWHAGDGNGQGNRASISVEMCESGDRELVIKRTQELVKYLMKKHNIRKVVRHYDWTKKNCPRILNNDSKWSDWSNFLADIYNQGGNKVSEQKVPAWKYAGIKYLHEQGLLDDLEGWKEKVDDPTPVWAVCLLLKKIDEQK